MPIRTLHEKSNRVLAYSLQSLYKSKDKISFITWSQFVFTGWNHPPRIIVVQGSRNKSMLKGKRKNI